MELLRELGAEMVNPVETSKVDDFRNGVYLKPARNEN